MKLIQHKQRAQTLLLVLPIRVKTSIRVLPRQMLSDRDDFYLFEIGRLNCRTFVFCQFVSKTSIRVKTSIHVKTSIRVLPRQILSDRDDFYFFEIGRLNCRTFVFYQFVSKTLICVKNVDSCLPVFVDSCQKTSKNVRINAIHVLYSNVRIQMKYII